MPLPGPVVPGEADEDVGFHHSPAAHPIPAAGHRECSPGRRWVTAASPGTRIGTRTAAFLGVITFRQSPDQLVCGTIPGLAVVAMRGGAENAEQGSQRPERPGVISPCKSSATPIGTEGTDEVTDRFHIVGVCVAIHRRHFQCTVVGDKDAIQRPVLADKR